MQPTIHIRNLTLEDLPCCAAIDGQVATPETAWAVRDFCDFLCWDTNGGLVAVHQGRVLGFLLCQADRQQRWVHMVRLAVVPAWRRRRIGSRLVGLVRQ